MTNKLGKAPKREVLSPRRKDPKNIRTVTSVTQVRRTIDKSIERIIIAILHTLDEKGETHDKRDRKKSREASSSKKPNREGFDNNQRCSKCKKGKGNMITCSSCPRSYHLECVTPKLEDVPKGTWNCEKCG